MNRSRWLAFLKLHMTSVICRPQLCSKHQLLISRTLSSVSSSRSNTTPGSLNNPTFTVVIFIDCLAIVGGIEEEGHDSNCFQCLCIDRIFLHVVELRKGNCQEWVLAFLLDSIEHHSFLCQGKVVRESNHKQLIEQPVSQ